MGASKNAHRSGLVGGAGKASQNAGRVFVAHSRNFEAFDMTIHEEDVGRL